MKAGWEVKPLGEVATIQNGGTPKSKVAEFWGGDVEWLTPKDMGKLETETVSSTPRKITELGLAKCSAKLVPANSVILSTRAPIGHLAMNTVPMAFNQGCRGLVPSNHLHQKYLFYFLAANVPLLNNLGTGTTFKELSAGALKGVPIPLPPLEEQKRIVAVLDAAFEGLDRARTHIQTNLQNARELFENSVEAELAKLPLDAETTIGDHVDLLSGFAFKSKEYSADPNDVRLMRGDNIIPGETRWAAAKYWPASNCAEYERYQLKVDDVLIAMDRTWISSGIKYAILKEEDVPSLLVQRVSRLRPLSSLSFEYLALLISSKAFEKYVLSIQTGVGVPHISAKQIKHFPVVLPELQKQIEIAEKMQAIQSKAAALLSHYTTKFADLDELRQSLLQKAFAGELT